MSTAVPLTAEQMDWGGRAINKRKFINFRRHRTMTRIIKHSRFDEQEQIKYLMIYYVHSVRGLLNNFAFQLLVFFAVQN